MVDSGNSYNDKVSKMVGWGHWFTFFNIVAAMLVGTRYITQSPWPETLLGQTYLALSWVGHFGFLVFALYLLILFPLTFISLSRKLFRFIAVCFSTTGLTLLLFDTQAYQQIHIHLNPIIWEVLLEGEQSPIAAELQQLFIVVPVIFLLELALSEWVWRKQRKLQHKKVGRPIAALFFICFISSHLTYMWADAFLYTPITSQKANFPLAYPMTAKTFMEKYGLLDREEYLRKREASENKAELISYPTEELKFSSRPVKHNILMVMVDNLRSDALSPEAMPNTYAFAAENQLFGNHYSSSNDNYGVFGLFYGIPSSYSSSVKAQEKQPLFLQLAGDNGYNFGLFSSSNFEESSYQDAIFKSKLAENASVQEANPQDSNTVDNWKLWLDNGPNTPWFSFIELTTVNDFEDFDVKDASLATPAAKLRASYNAAVNSVDTHIGAILATLAEKEVLDNTVVIITSNHGTEFNETKTNSWGHNTNYSSYQLKVPVVMHWPEKEAKVYTHRSSHFDISVTLLQELMGVSSNPSEYSSGQNLFNEEPRRWILAGDSRKIALITDKRTTVVDQYGNYKIFDSSYKRKRDENPKLSVLMQGLSELKRFYTKEQD
ncbi:DUF3413 domain-containing protein [Vibrio sp. JC009]|uniref:DUF3413 domain-containing protein n=1 Tax=Vibrio sp. JC009 TaxID=2912314 RepID=UPI0023AF1872|nr:DUF3413 domain-containing protein [Vibrio sp. JC009]WED20929.1 DUF3413 domain-containing protein [Vibrio sp. JC009]